LTESVAVLDIFGVLEKIIAVDFGEVGWLEEDEFALSRHNILHQTD
jgi:hypothetical protein